MVNMKTITYFIFKSIVFASKIMLALLCVSTCVMYKVKSGEMSEYDGLVYFTFLGIAFIDLYMKLRAEFTEEQFK